VRRRLQPSGRRWNNAQNKLQRLPSKRYQLFIE
jgi:hypothetical protein